MPTRSVNLILGPARSGKTDRALARYRQFLQTWLADLTQPEGVWIGPTSSAVSAIRDRLAQDTAGALLTPRTTTFAMLAEELIARGGRRIRAINVLEKQRILTLLIRELAATKQLRHYATVARTPGFIRQVGEVIADLKRRDIWAEDFRKQSRTDRDRDFSAIYSAYQLHLYKNGLYDAEGRFWAAREELTQTSLPHKRGESLQFGLVVLDGFADFTTAQQDLLRILGEHCQELLITLPAEHANSRHPRTLLFDKPDRTLARLRETFPQLQCEFLNATHFTSPGLAHAERAIFQDVPDKTAASTVGLTILAANSLQGEIREVARRVKEMLLNGTATADEIAVVFPSLHDVAGRVTQVFTDFGLPFALSSRQPLNTTPLARAATKLLQLHERDWPFDLLLDLISNAQGLQSLGDDGSYNTQASLERSVRRIQLPAGKTLLLDELRRWAALATSDVELSHEKQRIVRDAVIAAPILKQWSDLLGTLPTKATLTEWVAHWKTVLTAFGIIHKSSETHWQLFETSLSTIQTTDDRLGVAEEQLSSRTFLELWQTVADAVPLPSITENVGRVRVLSAESARNLSAKHVFLSGLSEQSFSSLESTGRLYSEHEITRFGTEATTAEQNAAQQTGESMPLFYDVLTRANDTLTLSYAALDDKGQALSPSPFVIELERALEPARISTITMPPGELVSEEMSPLSQSEWRTTSTAAALVGERAWLAGLASESKSRNLGSAILRGIHCVASRSKRETFGPYEGLLTSPIVHAAIARRFGSEHLWSPSQLETYAACPYQFFAKQILHLEPLTELTLRSDHLRRGTLLHQVLAAVHDQQEDVETSLTSEYLIERFTTALQRAIEATPLRGLEEALREIERREILAWAPQYAEQEINYRGQWQNFEEPFAPAHFEVRFGPKTRGEALNDAVSTLIPFTLDLGTEQIKLTGQIDRVDMGRIHGVTVFNIIDYKSGQEVKLADQEIKAGRQLQLPLYALAAEQLLFAEQRAVALATGYWSIKSTGFASGGKSMLEFRTSADHGLATSERWTGLNEVILDRVKEIIGGIRSAEFPVYNENKECTRYCDFSKICRIAQIRSLEKVWYPTTPDEQPPT